MDVTKEIDGLGMEDSNVCIWKMRAPVDVSSWNDDTNS